MLHRLIVSTNGPGLYEITRDALEHVEGSGSLHLFVRHTSASLLIQENADPEVQSDLRAFFERLVPPADHPSMAYLTHRYEGPDDMPAHIKAALLPTSLQIPVESGRVLLGRWQGIFLVEHRTAPHRREIVVQMLRHSPG